MTQSTIDLSDLPGEDDHSLAAVVRYLEALDWTVREFRERLQLRGRAIERSFEGVQPFPKNIIGVLRTEIRQRRMKEMGRAVPGRRPRNQAAA